MSHVAFTHRQEREAGDGSDWYETYRRIKTLKSKRSLWRLRQEKPELFAQQARQEAQVAEQEIGAPRGFGPCEREGWLYHPERRVYLERSTGRRYWVDAATQTYQDLYEGDALPLSFLSGAATAQDASREQAQGGSAGASVAGRTKGSLLPSVSATAHPSGPRHVAIPDLHRAAEALKVDLDHLDRPAAMLAVFGAAGSSAAPADSSACGLHMKLLRRLGAFRGEWMEAGLQEALIGALDDLAADHGGVRPSAAVVLAIGEHVVTAAAPGACFSLATIACGAGPSASGAAVAPSSSPAPAPPPSTWSAPLPSAPTTVASRGLALSGELQELHITLVAGAIGASKSNGDGEERRAAAAATPHLLRGRPRAASVALLRALRECGARGPLAAACARLGPATAGSEAGARYAGPAAKRQRVGESGGKFRVRQILLRHCSTARPMDPVRKKAVQRSLEEAESEMLDVLSRLDADGGVGFAGVCRAVSECQSALKGGELAGDLGWLDCSAAKSADVQLEKGKAAIRPEVPVPVLRTASMLHVGELGDLVCSELGVHLLQRTA
mmetsp:Transcript_34491/g.109525  ORF Transcript_34491/g.109525 Transcript_34491/m.109525 type:complete len:556 (-) Transcript_34491:103-1770(-)